MYTPIYALHVCVDIIYVDNLLMCVPECLIRKHVPYLIIMAFGRHSRWRICKRARTRTHARTHTHRHVLLHMLAFDLDVGRAIKTFRLVTALSTLDFDTCWGQ